jgi:hypothetical protein
MSVDEGERPGLWRTPVKISGEIEDIPPPPEGPGLFGMSEATTTIELDLIIGGAPPALREQNKIELKLLALCDGDGPVLSVNMKLMDKDGKALDYLTASVCEKDALAIGRAILPLFELARTAR